MSISLVPPHTNGSVLQRDAGFFMFPIVREKSSNLRLLAGLVLKNPGTLTTGNNRTIQTRWLGSQEQDRLRFFYGLESSLKLLNEGGSRRILKATSRALTDMLCETIDGNEFKIVSSRRPGEEIADCHS